MNRCLAALALATAAVLPLAAQADPVTYFVPYNGAGNLTVFDPVSGSGGWVGSIDQTPPPDVPAPLSLVSFVLFQFDAATLSLAGSFEFTTAADLSSTLFGDISGSVVDAGILDSGGQFSIDYTINGGTGAFAGASGFGLAFVDYDPSGTFNNYAESGLLTFTVASVPEPTSLALAAMGLLALGAARRRAAPLNSGA